MLRREGHGAADLHGVLEVIAVPAFALLLAPPRIGHLLPALMLILLLADIAFAVIGTFVSAIAINTRART